MSDPKLLAGGRYILVEPLGEGGMATVYRAWDQRLEVWRAIKVLAPHLGRRKKLVARFEAEARTMALLEHPNVVRVYDVATDGEYAYIVMELVSGGCIVDWMEVNGRVPPRLAAEICAEVAKALHAAHESGVVHRDVKPHNILLDRKGVCKVTDFGIARVNRVGQGLTRTGAVMGTWGYMAPEQRTDASSVDRRADVYALGAMLYAITTDRAPMDLFAWDRDPTVLQGLHPAFEPVVKKACAYERGDRYATADELRNLLLGIAEILPEVAPDLPPLVSREAGDFHAPPPPVPIVRQQLPTEQPLHTLSKPVPDTKGWTEIEVPGRRKRVAIALAGLSVVASALAGWSALQLVGAEPEAVEQVEPAPVAVEAAIEPPPAPPKAEEPPAAEPPPAEPVATAPPVKARPAKATRRDAALREKAVNQCVKGGVRRPPHAGGDAVLKVTLCAAPATKPTVFFRAPAGEWASKRLAERSGAWFAKLPLDETETIEYYVVADGAKLGSRGTPKRFGGAP